MVIMKIKQHGAIIEVSDEELKALYNFLESIDILKVWYDKGCTHEQIAIWVNMHGTIKDYLDKVPT